VKLLTRRKDRALQAGITLQYEGGIGDRRNTPKPLYRFHHLSVNPALIYRHTLGVLALHIHYRQQSEDLEMGQYVFDSPLLYRLRGYGTFSRTPFVSGTRLLNANTLGGSLEFNKADHNENEWSGFLSYDRTKGMVEEGIGITTRGGEWNTQIVSGEFNWKHNRIVRQWDVRTSSSLSRLSGIDPVFQAVNYYINRFSIRTQTRYTWNTQQYAQFDIDYSTRQQRDLVTVTDATIQCIGLSLNFYQSLNLSDNVKPFVMPHVGYVHVLDDKLRILSPTEISEKLVRADVDIMSQSYQQVSVKAGTDVRHCSGIMRISGYVVYLFNSTFDRTQLGASLNYFLNR
jgi:hypothetical protein